jgi:hypothetical protein
MIPHRPRIRNLLYTLPLLLGCPLTLSIQPSNAASVGKVRVMDVDDVRDAATIARTKARNRSESAENGESFGGGAFSSGCSDMNIGNVKGGVGNSVPRNVTIVIEGPVIQENNCR